MCKYVNQYLKNIKNQTPDSFRKHMAAFSLQQTKLQGLLLRGNKEVKCYQSVFKCEVASVKSLIKTEAEMMS